MHESTILAFKFRCQKLIQLHFYQSNENTDWDQQHDQHV